MAQLVRAPPCHGGGHRFKSVLGRFSRCFGKFLYADVAQLAEQLICNQQVIGSSPIIGFILYRYFLDGFPSGQRGQTVNLLSVTSVVRIHPHPLQTSMTYILPRGGAVWKLVGLITRRSEVQILPPLLCPDSSVGRAED